MREFWDKAAKDPQVRDKYIVDKNLKDADFIKFVKPYLHGKVLEIGCGIGRLAELYDCGIDISQNMLDQAPKDKEHKLCDGTSIPYPDESFDSVFCVQVFQHVPDTRPYISEAWRVLRPNGTFLFQYIHGWYQEGELSYRHIPYLGGWRFESRTGNIHKDWSWIAATK